MIASDIMYVVGQYPRFLRQHWKFLKTVIYKLFEFMHERFPGVQDMAVETYLVIAQACRRKFVLTQEKEKYPFLTEILQNLNDKIKDLDSNQVIIIIIHVCIYLHQVCIMNGFVTHNCCSLTKDKHVLRSSWSHDSI